MLKTNENIRIKKPLDENKKEIPNELKSNLNDAIFGCDICQDVCPWNKFSRPKITPKYGLGFFTWWIDEEKQNTLFSKKPELKN